MMMNRKLITLILASLIVFAACGDSKWNQPLPEGTPQEFIDQQEAAIEKNEKNLQETPDDKDALFKIAFSNHQLGKYKEAVKYYEKVLSQDPTDYASLNNIADIYEQVEEYALSAKYIKTLYENNETDNEVIRDTVRILLKNDEPAAALSALENFARKTKDTATSEELVMISDLFESIQLYKQQYEETTN